MAVVAAKGAVLMAPWYDYSCSLGHTTESREGYDTIKIRCPDCGELAFRLAVYREQGIVTESAPSRFTVARDRSV